MKTVAPFFIVGTGRSGTTLLQGMFMAAEGIFIPPETHFLPLADRAERRAGPPSASSGRDALIGEVLAMCRRQEMPADPVALEAELRAAPPTRGDLFDALLDHVKRRRPGCRRIGEKSPVHLPHAAELLRLFPDGKVITIIRDGRDVALSHEQTLDRGTLRAALRWRCDQRLHARWAQTLPEDRYAWVRYEDLVTDPEPQLRRLCRFLGEPFDQRMLRPHERGESGFATWETHKALTREPVTTARIGRYKTGLSRAQIALFQAICARELRAHGYALEPVPRLAGLGLGLRQIPDLALTQLRLRALPPLAGAGSFFKPLVPAGLRRLRWSLVNRRRLAVVRKLLVETNRTVQSGPFAGMAYVAGAVGSALGPKLLGTYERELGDLVEEICNTPFDLVIDVGAAEGYYACGLLLRCGRLRVTAFEADRRGRRLLARMATINGVRERLKIRGFCDASALSAELDGEPLSVCIIMDVEGGELALLDRRRLPGLSAVHVLVELHDFVDPKISETIRERFSSTHTIRCVLSEPRDATSIPHIGKMTAQETGMMADERRPAVMSWYWMTPRRPE